MVWLSIIAVVIAGFLGFELYRRLASDRIAGLIARRQSTSRMIGRAEFVDGNRHLEVALAVTASTLFYENSDMQGLLDLDWIREVEYDTELATGLAVHGSKVLRVRSDSQTFEFVLPDDDATRWCQMLPPRRVMERAVAQ